MSRSLHLPVEILKVWVEALMGFSHLSHPRGLNNTLLTQGHVLEDSSHCGSGGQMFQGPASG